MLRVGAQRADLFHIQGAHRNHRCDTQWHLYSDQQLAARVRFMQIMFEMLACRHAQMSRRLLQQDSASVRYLR